MRHRRRIKLLALSAALGGASLIVTALPAQAYLQPPPHIFPIDPSPPVTNLFQSAGCGTFIA